jgi:hypothetical protein
VEKSLYAGHILLGFLPLIIKQPVIEGDDKLREKKLREAKWMEKVNTAFLTSF